MPKQAITDGARHIQKVGIDIHTHDNIGSANSVLSNINVPLSAIPVGINEISLLFVAPAAIDEYKVVQIRWDGVTDVTKSFALSHGKLIVLKVPKTGNRILNYRGQSGIGAGGVLYLQQLG